MNKRLISVLSLLLVSPAAFGDEAGTVVFARGDVTAERAPPVALTKGDSVEDDDTIATGEASRAQLLMIDGAKIAIRPASRLRIEEYSHTAPAAATLTTSEDKSSVSLLKGGFRTITGAIGKDDPDEYEVRTPVGVLGIRGTDYTAVFCNGDCNWVPGLAAGASIADGLYLGVSAGVIVFRTTTTTIELRAGEYAFIPLQAPEPQRLTDPPPVLLDDNDLRFDASDRSADDRGFDAKLGTRRVPESSAPDTGDGSGKGADSDDPAAPDQPIIGVDPNGNPVDLTPGQTPDPSRQTSSIAYGSGSFGALAVPLTGADDNEPSQLLLDGNGDAIGFESNFAGRTGADTAVFDIGTATNVDTGSDSMTVMRWGRWTGGSASITTVSDGITTPIDLGSQSIHWVSGADGGIPAMPIAGVATYTLIGNTLPTDNLGNVGILGSATFQADFVNMLVDSTLVIDIAGSTWDASGQGSIGGRLPAHLFEGLYNNVSVDGIGGGTGSFSGFFSEPGPTADPQWPGAAGLTYSLQDAQGSSTVSGAAVFGNPQ